MQNACFMHSTRKNVLPKHSTQPLASCCTWEHRKGAAAPSVMLDINNRCYSVPLPFPSTLSSHGTTAVAFKIEKLPYCSSEPC